MIRLNNMTSFIRKLFVALLINVFLLLGCEETPPDAIISQFNRPQDVSLVCVQYDEDVDDQYRPGPLSDCEFSGTIFALVTQTTMGEVAVVNAKTSSIIDQDVQVPFNSFIPVGGQPSDIDVAYNSKYAYTINYETEDLSRIDVAHDAFGPSMMPAVALDLDGPAARILVAKKPDRIRDRYAFITQPTLGRLLVVRLLCPVGFEANNQTCDIDKNELTPGEACTEENDCCGSCIKVIGYMRIDSATGLPNAPVDERLDGVRPYAMTASGQNESPDIYLSGLVGHYILAVDGSLLANVAEQNYEATPTPCKRSSTRKDQKAQSHSFSTLGTSGQSGSRP